MLPIEINSNPLQIDNQGSLIIAKYLSNPLKRISFNRFEGHAIRWHDPYRRPDRDGNPFDLTGEWFSQKTNRMLKMGYPIVGAPVNYQHGMHKDFGATGIGLLDFTEEDEIGQFVKGELYEREQYIEMLRDIGRLKGYQISDVQYNKRADMALKAVQTLVNEVPLQFSGGFDPSTWVVDPETKHIDQSGLIHLAFTPTPADDLNPIVAFKSAFSEAFKLEHERKTFDMSPPASPAKEAQPIERGADNEIPQDNPITNKTNKGQNDMDAMALLKQIAATLQEFFAGAGEAPADAMAMAGEVEEEMKAEAEKLPEEEAKAVDEELVKAWMNIALVKAEAKLAKKARLSNVAKSQAQEALNAWKAKQPVSEEVAKGLPKYTGGNRPAQISVSELRAYTSLSAGEMALGVKLAMSRVPEHDRKMWKLADLVERDILSEAYVKTMAHKSAQRLKSWQLAEEADEPEQNDYATMKAYSFLKADELHATDITNQGAEWVEMMYDTDLWRRVRNETELFNLMESKGMRVKDIPTGVKGMNVKLEDGSGTVYTLQEGHSVAGDGYPEAVANLSQITTNEVEESLATHIIAQGFTFQLQERSIIDVVGYLNEDMQTTLTEALEDAFINGDKTTTASSNINRIDSTVPVGIQAPLYLAWDGIRHNYIVDNVAYASDNAGAALAATDYEKVRALWPLRIRRRKNNILFLIDEGIETQTRRLAEHFTVGVAGESNATFFTGDLNVLVGYDVYASGYMGLTNGDGKISVTAANNVKGQITGVFAPYWQYGRQLQIKVEEARFPLSQASVFVATVNHLLKARSAYAAVGKYDIAVS